MAALPASAHHQPAEDLEPLRGSCPRCGADVLAVELADGGGEVVVEVAEVIEAFPCPSCRQVAQMGHRRRDCIRCGLTGVIGEPFPLRGVAVDAAGHGRIFTGTRHEAEAVMRFHACQ